jgi:hypothetical protein
MAGAIYPSKLVLADEIRDVASAIAATVRRTEHIAARLPAAERVSFIALMSLPINGETAPGMRAIADRIHHAAGEGEV